MKKILLLVATTATFSLYGQVTKVDYLLEYNCETNLYEVKLKVLDGSATTIPQRAQFNAQMTLVLPTGTDLEIIELVNPIQNNHFFTGTEPTEWVFGAELISPVGDPAHDFYPAAPKLAPASFYDNLEAGDETILFTCKIGDSDEYNPNYRFYNNDTDVNFVSFGEGNYSNGFTLGSPLQIYNGNQNKSCTTKTQDELHPSLVVFPNPFSYKISVELVDKTESIDIVDYSGKVVYSSLNQEAGIFSIHSSQFPTGSYILRIQTANSYQIKQIVKP